MQISGGMNFSGGMSIVGPNDPVIAGQVIVSAGFYTSSVIDRNFKLWIWGYGASGEMGQGNRISRSSPIQVGADSWSQVSGGNQSIFAIKSNGTLWSWGSDFGTGSLGLNTSAVNRSSPAQIGSNTNWSQVIRAGTGVGGATGAINNLMQLFAWGLNDYGTLGQNNIISRSSPVQIAGSWTLATIGYGTSMAIDTAGKLFTWGQNGTGQLGSNNTISRSSPVQIMTTTSFVFISASDNHQGAIDTLGRLWVWGSSFSGQLGNNSTTNKSSPVQIPGSWSVVSMGDAYTHAIKTDGTLWAWGLGTEGKLGLGDRISRSSPIQVGTSSWISISSGFMGPVGVTVSNVVYAWGRDAAGSTIMGRIGAGVVVDRSSPYQVGTY